MIAPQTAPYGAWRSPITTDMIVSETINIGQLQIDGPDLYWIEMRPTEEGRYVLVRRGREGHIADVTPAPYNVRSRVHEYGGRAYLVVDGTVYFCHFADQRLYRQDPATLPVPITPPASYRYADFVPDRRRQRLISVREDHGQEGREAVNAIVAVGVSGGDGGQVLVAGNDFYAAPRVSPDGSQLCWLTWNHPNMPWDGTELWVGEFRPDGKLTNVKRIAGGPTESIFQPAWSPDGILYFVSDRTGWWNLYRWLDGHIEPLCPMEAEFGLPQWSLGAATYTFDSPDYIVCIYSQQGDWQLARLHTTTGERESFDFPFTWLATPLVNQQKQIIFLAGSPRSEAAIVQLDRPRREYQIIRHSSRVTIDANYLSVPRAIEFPTENDQKAHAFFYPPHNADFVAPTREKPPLLVISHGGPTFAARRTLDPQIQFWTSRGFAVLDVNYGGSTGYGRAYRQRLNGQWGIVDVDDCANGALYAARQGWVDGRRLAIRGGSAGGYTTLAVLAFRRVFHAGASYFGVSDLERLAQETHKFESRYLDRLIGPYPEERELYLSRSPIHATEQFSCPVIFFQGLEDKVVPANQAEKMVAALKAKGVPVAYLPFAGEQHGFRRAENIKRSMEAELYFYSRIFDFPLADEIEPIEIANID